VEGSSATEITREQAVVIAEQYVAKQGYTSKLGNPEGVTGDTMDLVRLLPDGGVDREWLLRLHADQIEEHAYRAIRAEEAENGYAWAVVFRCSASMMVRMPLARRACETYGPTIVMDSHGQNVRRLHTGLRLQAAQLLPPDGG
jgi:hypothetical protein